MRQVGLGDSGALARFMVAFAAIALLSVPAWAETLRLRAGEHEGFSRIVIDLAAAADWTFGRSSDGYELRLAREDAAFDVSGVYDMIPRRRLADLASAEGGALRFKLDCDCHAKAFATASGAIVVDIADGAPSPGSPFETPIETGSAAAPSSDLSDVTPQAARSHWPPPTPGDRRQAVFDSGLAFFWRGIAPPTSVATDGADAATSAAKGVRPAGAGSMVAPAPSRPDLSDPVSSNQATSGAVSPGPVTHPVMIARPLFATPRVAAAQEELLLQLGRAAAQGLVEVDTARTGLSARSAEAVETTPTEQAKPALPARSVTEPPGIHAETSIDRESRFTSIHPPVTADGGACLGSEAVNIAAWGDGRPAAIQIAEKRHPLVGEFDRPSDEAVLAIVRLYLFLGFGAEARAVLAAFAVDGTAVDVLGEIALILDGRHPGPESRLPGMTGCDSPAALWAVLGWPDLPADADVDEGAVLLAFSALPPHLRRSLGAPLAERLLSVGAGSAARAVRDSIARSPVEAEATLSMIDARLDLTRGDAAGAEAALEPLARGNDPLAVEALILTIRSKLDRDEAVDVALADSAEALAFERQDGPQGPVLTQLHILARGAAGDFARAFDAYERWPGAAPEEVRHDTLRRLFALLAARAEEPAFLNNYFARRGILEAAGPDAVLRLDLAGRLVRAGFAAEAQTLLEREAGQSDRGRRLLAEAALAEFEPAEALRQLAGLRGAADEAIRARALTMAGDHKAAAAAFARAGDAETAARAAWRAGDWGGVVEGGPDAMRQAVRDLGLLRQDGAGAAIAVEPPGELARSRAFLADSQTVRATLESLLAATAEQGG